ncbi:ABC transporter substrate-binding protein [Azomonas macrocytogenes]|uniref:Iron complex transport system substrate-binding protein n=1 Tax=Azomonas macrocytogenes TaxID=69962 RepID=A0A839T621_AZOMA|nr:ABC transporter substrate-binding protein [Azomonas macrocytogenes]MBB3104548.1 iron complex transport system substrate-binding protein [Azomonas macrocytogenes]
MNRRQILGTLGLLGALLATSNPVFAERQITDMAGRRIEIPDKVEKVYAIGHCIPIVGAVAPQKLANNYHLSEAALRFLPPVFIENKVIPNTGNSLSDEEVMKMAPDLVVMEKIPGAQERADRLQERLKTPVLLVDLDMLQYKQAFTFLGELLQQPEQGRKLADFVATNMDPIAEKAKSIAQDQRVRVYYAEGPDGLSTNPAGNSHTQVLDFVGGINVAKVTNLPDEGMSSVSLEQLYIWQPDVILAWTPAADRLTTWKAIVENPLWQKVKAVKAGQVLQVPWIPFSWFDRPPSSNRILGTFWLAQTLYPQTFQFDMTTLTQEYFRLFYHKEISAAEVRYLLDLARPTAAASR